jgi:hypothetical protein
VHARVLDEEEAHRIHSDLLRRGSGRDPEPLAL